MIWKLAPDGRLMAMVGQTERPVAGQPGLYEAVQLFQPLKVRKDGYLVIEDGVTPIEMKVPAYGG